MTCFINPVVFFKSDLTVIFPLFTKSYISDLSNYLYCEFHVRSKYALLRELNSLKQCKKL